MGYASTGANVLAVLQALGTQLARQGYRLDEGAGVAAAARALSAA
jgi:hypothetical protein